MSGERDIDELDPADGDVADELEDEAGDLPAYNPSVRDGDVGEEAHE